MEYREAKPPEMEPQKKRALLREALSFIQGFSGRIVVIKYGGAAMVQDQFKTSFAEDVVLLQSLGLKPVIVHGGGPEVSRVAQTHGLEAKFIDGLRITDLEQMKVSEMVLSGAVNKEIVTHLQIAGGLAVGLSGKDGKLIQARKLAHSTHDLGYVGEVDQVNPDLIFTLIDKGYIPVISPIGIGHDNLTYNINADTAASAVAAALKAQKVIFLTDVKGVLHQDRLISKLSVFETRQLIEDGVIKGGMKPKVEGMIDALAAGVVSAHIIGGMDHHALIAELFTEQGIGTMIVN
ncbi:MAG: acetylglutamate kinase [bacterium]|nr:acetylglutamate kinase [bacterium]